MITIKFASNKYSAVKLRVSFFLFLFFSNMAFGAPDPKCVVDRNDPYDPAVVMTFGDYKGQCVDATTTRAPVVLSQDASEIKIANFYQDGRFWLATVPKNSVREVLYQGIPFEEHFAGLIVIAHAQLRFKLEKPIQLELQSINRKSRANVRSTGENDPITSTTTDEII